MKDRMHLKRSGYSQDFVVFHIFLLTCTIEQFHMMMCLISRESEMRNSLLAQILDQFARARCKCCFVDLCVCVCADPELQCFVLKTDNQTSNTTRRWRDWSAHTTVTSCQSLLILLINKEPLDFYHQYCKQLSNHENFTVS